jgi:hypothetical protein
MSCAIALALLGGCSSSQNATSIPSSGGGAPGIQGGQGKMTMVRLLQTQLAGQLPAPMPHSALERQLKYVQTHPQQAIKVDKKGGKIGMWVTVPDEDALLALSANGRQTIGGINVSSYGGYYPITVKVDKYKNVWVANVYNDTFSGSNVQEYDDKGNFVDNYSWGLYLGNAYCGSGSGTLYFCDGEGFDSAETTNSVFASETEFSYEYEYVSGSKTIYTTDHGSGIYQFKLGDPSQTPTFRLVSDAGQGLNCSGSTEYASCDEVYFMDTDASGNVWFDYYGSGGGGLGEMDKHGHVYIITSGSLEYPGGVTIAGKGHNQVLTVIDQDARVAYQYRLPVTSSSTPFNTLGPTKTNLYGYGDPGSGGFNVNGTKLAIGDFDGWIDICKAKTTKCKQATNVNLTAGAAGAAYTPSNK